MNPPCPTPIELTDGEADLFATVERGVSAHDHDALVRACHAAPQLIASLQERSAIPGVRLLYFTDPERNIGGHGLSRAEWFVRNGTRGAAILSDGNFLPMLVYFVSGPDLPRTALIAPFWRCVVGAGVFTSGDLMPLRSWTRDKVRTLGLDPRKAHEEVYKLALECGLACHEAASIRGGVQALR